MHKFDRILNHSCVALIYVEFQNKYANADTHQSSEINCVRICTKVKIGFLKLTTRYHNECALNAAFLYYVPNLSAHIKKKIYYVLTLKISSAKILNQ